MRPPPIILSLAVLDQACFAGPRRELALALAACRNDSGQLGGMPNSANAIQGDADGVHQRVFHRPRPEAPGVNKPGHV